VILKRERLLDLYGSLPATRPFPDKEEVRDEVGKTLGEEMELGVGGGPPAEDLDDLEAPPCKGKI
jgi:hypothetical protein